MNDKVKQLAQQSALWDRLNPRTLGICDSSTENVWGEELQEFAELIVQECADFADEHNSEVEGVTLGVGKAIKQHFGVELEVEDD